MDNLSERARGRWLAILPAIGIKAEFLTGKNGPCVFCGGKDRWRFLNSNGSGSWICNQCGAGSGFELTKRFLGVSYHDAYAAIENLLRDDLPIAREKPRDHVALRDRAKRMWLAASPLTGDDVAGRYLRSRRIELPTWPKALRVFDGVMVGKIVTADDRAINLHRTFLPSGPKKFLPGVVPPGSAIRLLPHVGVLGIAEGIETALSAFLMFGVPCWAACHARGVETFTPPPDVRALCIYADNDDSAIGQAVAWAAARRLRARGMAVDVKVPEKGGADWNDVLMSL